MGWNPRGEPTWPNWRDAASGTRVQHVRTARQGTFVKASKNRNNGAIVDWDRDRTPVRGYVVAPAYDLKPI